MVGSRDFDSGLEALTIETDRAAGPLETSCPWPSTIWEILITDLCSALVSLLFCGLAFCPGEFLITVSWARSLLSCLGVPCPACLSLALRAGGGRVRVTGAANPPATVSTIGTLMQKVPGNEAALLWRSDVERAAK